MLRQLFIILFICTIGVAAVTAMEVNGISLLKGEQVCIVSGFEGRLTLDGKPASGARIVRKFN